MTGDDRPTLADLAATPVPPRVEVDHPLVPYSVPRRGECRPHRKDHRPAAFRARIHGRWVDDIAMVGAARGACRAARDVVALTLATLGLTLSEQKTYFDSRSDGLARLRSKEISLIEAVGRMDSELQEELILASLMRRPEPASPSVSKD